MYFSIFVHLWSFSFLLLFVFKQGNFILALKEIKFGTFSDKICEKFCDLYWDEKLLENLYQVVNGERVSPLWYVFFNFFPLIIPFNIFLPTS